MTDEKIALPDSESMSESVLEENTCEESILEDESIEVGQKNEESGEDEIDRLRKEISELKESLKRQKAESEKILSELGEFSELFPEENLKSIPDEVWEKVKSGVPIAAAYALYEKRSEARRKHINELNVRNADRSSGSIVRGGEEMYYSPTEVKKMSAAEVKQKYNIIIESMKKWN